MIGLPRVPSSIAARMRCAAGQKRRWNSTPSITSGVVAGRHHALRGRQFDGDRLLAEHVDPGRGSLQHHVLVGGVRRADRDKVKAQGQQLAHAC